MSTRFKPETQLLNPRLLNPLEAPVREAEATEQEERDTSPGDGFRVILYNDDYHSVDEVVLQIQKATGYDIYRATAVMLEAHTKGRAVCFRGEREKCHRVANILRQIRLQVEVDCD
jgi:ATP-dependent Clp protease adapter protein ClpS